MNDRKSATTHVGTAALGCPVEQSSTRWSIRKPFKRLQLWAQLFFAALREIFDESAYARFLNQRKMVSSRAAYAAFRQEYEGAKARRPRCC
jgi:hypothetical protein